MHICRKIHNDNNTREGPRILLVNIWMSTGHSNLPLTSLYFTSFCPSISSLYIIMLARHLLQTTGQNSLKIFVQKQPAYISIIRIVLLRQIIVELEESIVVFHVGEMVLSLMTVLSKTMQMMCNILVTLDVHILTSLTSK